MRIVRGAVSATIEFQPVDQHGDPADPDAPVTVTVTRFNGDTVATSVVSGAGADARTATIAAAELATVDRLTAVWSIDGVQVHTEHVDVVGGILATPSSIKALDPTFNGTDTAELRSAIEAVESMVEAELNRCLHERLVVDRTWCGTYHSTSRADVLEVVGAYDADGTTIDVTDAQTTWASVQGPRFADGGTVGYIAGMDIPPPDLVQNLAVAVSHQLAIRGREGYAYNADTIRMVDGAVITTARAGFAGSITGNDEVDAAIKRHRYQPVGIA